MAERFTLGNLAGGGSSLGNLGDALGDPRAANPTFQQALAAAAAQRAAAPGPNGPPPTPEQIHAYLALTAQQYPQLYPVNPAGWEAFLARAPESINIDDRRGINRRR